MEYQSALPKQKISLHFSFSFFAPHFLKAKGTEFFWFRLAGAERKREAWLSSLVVVCAPQGARKTAREAFRFLSVLPRAPRVISRDDFQNKFGFHPKGTAILRFCRFWQNWKQSFALHTARCARKGLVLQRFATLRVAKRKVLGFGFETSRYFAFVR